MSECYPACPFCDAEIQNSDGDIVHKEDCYIIVHFFRLGSNRDRDERAWKVRPIEDKLRAECDRLSFKVERLHDLLEQTRHELNEASLDLVAEIEDVLDNDEWSKT